MKVLITGANGFVGRNLRAHLAERKNVFVSFLTRESDENQLQAMVDDVDFIFHLAGTNRPQNPDEFSVGNTQLTEKLCAAVVASRRSIPVLFTSTTHASRDSLYGVSKRAAEDALFDLQRTHGVPVRVFRLTNVFGKWSKPNYNSAVATFCHNIARDLDIRIDDPEALLTLVYVDDVVRRFVEILDECSEGNLTVADDFQSVAPEYTISVGELARQIRAFKESRSTLVTEPVGTGLVRALHSTYLSYLPVADFAYQVPRYSDPRGVFVEMLKTADSGQFSYFTAKPGITRGGHYHHSKTEKFLVIKGRARFKFRHIDTAETHELVTDFEEARIVETVPGWTHDITNIGDEEMIVMLWANEIFDRQKPDTFNCPV